MAMSNQTRLAQIKRLVSKVELKMISEKEFIEQVKKLSENGGKE